MDPSLALLISRGIDLFIAGMNREDIMTEVNAQTAAGKTPKEIAKYLAQLVQDKIAEAQKKIDGAV